MALGRSIFCRTAPASGDSPSACVTKLSADGRTILWQNNLGFRVGFAGTAFAVDPNGGVYVIPGLTAPDLSTFVAKLSASGTGLAWKTQVSAPGVLIVEPSLAVDSQGRAYVAGPVGPNYRTSNVMRLNSAGSAVEYTAQVTGNVTSIAVDRAGGLLLTGNATVPFLSRLAPDGSASFYTPLAIVIYAAAVAVDPKGNAVILGRGAGGGSLVLQRFDSTGAAIVSSIVGNTTSGAQGTSRNLALDASGNAYVTGSSYIYNTGFYLSPARNSLSTCSSEWLSVFAPDGTLLQATYLPTSGFESIVQAPFVATGPNSTVFVASLAGASFVPLQAGPFPVGRTAGNSFPHFLWRLSPNADAQVFPLACLGSAATYVTDAIAPGGLVTLFGNGLGPQQGVQTQATLQTPFPTRAAGVEVTFDGTPAPLLWVQDSQVNLVAPWSLTPGETTRVCVTYNGVKTNCLTWPVLQTSPAVLTVDGVHAAFNQEGTVNSADNPAAPGSILSIFATGLGPISPAQADGSLIGFPLPSNVFPVSVYLSIGQGRNPPRIVPLEVTYAGPAPFMVGGISQINFKAVVSGYPVAIGMDSSSTTRVLPFAIYVAGQ